MMIKLSLLNDVGLFGLITFSKYYGRLFFWYFTSFHKSQYQSDILAKTETKYLEHCPKLNLLYLLAKQVLSFC